VPKVGLYVAQSTGAKICGGWRVSQEKQDAQEKVRRPEAKHRTQRVQTMPEKDGHVSQNDSRAGLPGANPLVITEVDRFGSGKHCSDL
jgi:hypothetical protein